MVRGKPGAWDPKPCLVFAERLLRFVRSTLETEGQANKHGADALATLGDSEPDKKAKGPSNSVQDSSQTVWRLEIRPNAQDAILYKLEPNEVEEVRNGEDRVGFLPTWFWQSATGVKV